VNEKLRKILATALTACLAPEDRVRREKLVAWAYRREKHPALAARLIREVTGSPSFVFLPYGDEQGLYCRRSVVKKKAGEVAEVTWELMSSQYLDLQHLPSFFRRLGHYYDEQADPGPQVVELFTKILGDGRTSEI
jgi:hypothetical protein